MNAAVFHQAVLDGDATKVKLLINIGQQARVNQRNKHGYTSLLQSCKSGKVEVAEVLLSHGANIAAVDRKGRTALHLASAGGFTDLVKLLIASCADISSKDNEGKLAIDVARKPGIVEILSKAAEEKEAKNPDAKKKSVSEDWSQNVTSLPPGSRNSLVSNSSSDSGVFSDENSIPRTGDYAKITRPNGYTSNRAIVGDSRVMEVLNESDENMAERDRERSSTLHEIGSSATTENSYDLCRERSHTLDIESHVCAEPLLPQGRRLNADGFDERNFCASERHLNAETLLHEENQRELGSHLIAQTTVTAQHNKTPRPKLRRSMSERLPSRQRKRFSGRRDISEELSALNLSRAIARQREKEALCEDARCRPEVQDANLECVKEPHSPEEDLGYVGDSNEDLDKITHVGRSSMRKYLGSETRTLPRRRSGREEFHPARNDRCDEDEAEFRCGLSHLTRSRPKVCDPSGIQVKNTKTSRRQTIEVFQNTIGRYGALAASERDRAFWNERAQNFAQLERFRNRRVPENGRIDSRDFSLDESYLIDKYVNLSRKNSACSDTAIGRYQPRFARGNRGCGIAYDDYVDACTSGVCFEEEYSRKLPSYEETFKRRGSERYARRPASRQVSHV